MGGIESKATVLENMIKNFKRDLWRLWDKDDAQLALHSLWNSSDPQWEYLATRGYHGLKFNKDSLCHSYGKTWTHSQFPYKDSWLGIAQDPATWA